MNISKALRFAAFMGFTVVTVTVFQNCGSSLPKGIGASTGSSSSQSGDRFKAGDAYSANKLPYTPQGRLIQDAAAYQAITGFKAMAVAPNGAGVGVGNQQYRDQAEANQIALEACQIESRNVPCALFAEGNTIKYDESVFLTKFASVIESGPRLLDVTKIPTYLQYWESIFLNNYTSNNSPFKAIAIGQFGLAMHGWGSSQAEANRRALEFAEAIADRPVTLYAQGTTVVFNVTSWNWNYNTKYLVFGPAAFQASAVPFLADADRTNANTVGAIPTLSTQGRNPVLAISRYGHYYIGLTGGNNLADNRSAALAGCNSQLTDPKVRCVIYSEGNQVVWTRATLDAGNISF